MRGGFWPLLPSIARASVGVLCGSMPLLKYVDPLVILELGGFRVESGEGTYVTIS